MSVWVDDSTAPLLTDLYQLNMLQAYFEQGLQDVAVFDLFVRKLPENRNYLVACGLADALEYLENLRFTPDALRRLERLRRFPPAFLDRLSKLRFTGDVWAVPEGTVVFAGEPLLEVVAPLPEAQFAETFVINQIHLQTVAASKAARVVTAAAGRSVVDFGLRRMHGTDAGMKCARAFWIAGVAATSNVLAGEVYRIPVAGTMAHSYIQAHESELEAFRRFAATHPETVLLVDTYDTLEGVENVIRLARELGSRFRVRAIRLDSGDLLELSRKARRSLDEGGLAEVGIFTSSSLDEYAIAELAAAGAPIVGFGVGTRMGVSSDAPALDMVYKLVAYGGRGRIKLSQDKSTLPGRKQVFRRTERGEASGDTIALAGERETGRALLGAVMKGGVRLPAGESDLSALRERARSEIASLPPRCRALEPAAPPYLVRLSAALGEELERARRLAGRSRE